MHEKHGLVHWDSGGELAGAKHVIFLGTFNATPYRLKIENWLPKLDLGDSHLVISDNASTDDTHIWLTHLAQALNSPVTVLRNPKNFGGYGNLAINLKHFPKAEWITTLHQDDVYTPEHIRNHKSVIWEKIPNLGMICSEASSFLLDGRNVPFPRANWLLDDNTDAVTIFLANLKNHTYPFSGATFSRSVMEKFPIPWHSTAFPDTEIVMKMCLDFVVTFAPGVTVHYLENPDSESHSLLQQHRDFGAFQALIRVFAHPNYKRLCGLVNEEQQPSFISSLREGISERIKDGYLSLLMQQAALEITASHMPIGPDFANQLAKGYQFVGDKGAMAILEAIGSRDANQTTPATYYADSEFISTGFSSKSIPPALTLAKLIPYKWRRKIFRLLMKTSLGRSRLKQWDFDWRAK